jgi:gliding motility-associated-like protein
VINNKRKKIVQSFLLLITCLVSLRAAAQCSALINTFPYSEGFESGTGLWTSGGVNNDWTWGTPVKPVISSAANGTKCWITGGLNASFYSYGQRSWVESPCFDFSLLDHPFISFSIFWDTEWNYDGGSLQYSLDNGLNWTTAGTASDPVQCNDQNWYNKNSISFLNSFLTSGQGWSGNTSAAPGSCSSGNGSGEWKVPSHCLNVLANKPSVKFRFTFGSGTLCNAYDGIAFDDFYIGKAPAILSDFTFICVGPTMVDFSDASGNCNDHWQWDFDDPASSQNSAAGNNVHHEFSQPGTYNVIMTSGGHCSEDTIISRQVKILGYTVSTTEVSCNGDSDGSATLMITNSGAGLTINWNTVPVQNTLTASGLQVGNYSAVITENNACSITTDVNIVNAIDASPVIDLGSDTTICPGSEIKLSPGIFSAYQWQDGSSDSTLLINKSGLYFIEAANSSGCIAADTIVITEDCLNDILFPSAFTPDGDNINEVFLPAGTLAEKFSLMIFNRWGEKIFESDDQFRGWDGSFKGKFAEEGVYVYVAKFETGYLTETEKHGAVLLIR